MSPFSAKTTSSTVKALSTLTMAKPTLRVINWPLAMTKAKELLARRGYDPVYGARPLKRIIQRELETKLSRALLRGEITDNSRVEVVATKGELEFKSKLLARKAEK